MVCSSAEHCCTQLTFSFCAYHFMYCPCLMHTDCCLTLRPVSDTYQANHYQSVVRVALASATLSLAIMKFEIVLSLQHCDFWQQGCVYIYCWSEDLIMSHNVFFFGISHHMLLLSCVHPEPKCSAGDSENVHQQSGCSLQNVTCSPFPCLWPCVNWKVFFLQQIENPAKQETWMIARNIALLRMPDSYVIVLNGKDFWLGATAEEAC